MAGTFGAGAKQITVRMANVSRALDRPAITKRLTAAGVAAKKAAAPVPNADLGGNNSFSGWRRKSPIPLQIQFRSHRDGLGITFHRQGRSAGPWRVAQSGRNQNSHTGFAGPGINRRTGLTSRTKTGRVSRPRAIKAKRWNGRTAGKGTWSKAAVVLEKTSRETFEKATRKEAAAAFKGR